MNSSAASVIEVPAPPEFVRTLIRIVKLCLEAAALVALASLFFIRMPQVSGHSMEPQLRADEHVLINTLAYGVHAGGGLHPLVDIQLRPIKRGDVVAFQHAVGGDGGQVYVKRVIGTAGDSVAIVRGIVVVDGRPLAEPYVSLRDGASMRAQVVPADSLFVLGDNRGASDDSRAFGSVPRTSVIGRAAFVVWPFNRAGPIR
jgi:signal peptidase I